MKKFLLFAGLVLSSFGTIAQDTIWVQTFTYDSITTRRANFVFPEALNNMRFEKVLMYYKLKCSPLTTWDQYDCGEWDYLTYTRVFDHTGNFDSVRVDGNRFLSDWASPATINYAPVPYVYADSYARAERNRSGATLTNYDVSNGAAGVVHPFPFNVAKHGGRYQMMLTAAELTAAGITAGDLQSLSLFLNDLTVNGELKYPVISLKSTTDATLTGFHSTGFTPVYNASRWTGGSQSELVLGQNELLFYQPYAWNGTDNLIVEFYFANSMESMNTLGFEADDSSQDAVYYNSMNGCIEFSGSNYSMLELSDFDLGSEMTITFWAKGTGSAGTNTSILEAYDLNGDRTINIHMPWSDNNMYFDAGAGSGYDRISKAMTGAEIDNNWNHWAFVKKQSTGEMFVYKNGVLWHSGTNKNMAIGYISRFIIGSNMNQQYLWKGKLDEFQLYNTALPQATIQAYMTQQPNAAHPNWNNLLVYYDFDDTHWAQDKSQNDWKLMPSQTGMFRFNEYPQAGVMQDLKRPRVAIGQGTVTGVDAVTYHPELKLKEPQVIFEQQPVAHHFEIINSYLGLPQGTAVVYNENGDTVSQVPFTGTNVLTNEQITYYREPYEIIKDIEIARYITPYGINFDLGPQGFAWIYDVTDYQHLLRDTVDLAAHNTQELLDLRFAFIEGIPPRDVQSREPIWADFRSYNFANLANDVSLQSKNVYLPDTSDMFKIKTRLSGHGQVGDGACCEWVPNDHQIKVNGSPTFNWNIWQTTECGDNPNIGQGGTWPYAREGWCPGDMVREHEFELTPYVTPGDSVAIDYSVNQVPTNDPGQAGGNYIMAFDLISYSAPNFQHDAAIVDVLNPNNYEYYSKYNPTCSNPRVILQNTGEQPLTKCKIRCWITYGDWIEYEWTGNLGFLEKEIVEIPVPDISWWTDLEGNLTFSAQVYNVEGDPGLDEYSNNNFKQTKFKAPELIDGPFFVWFTTNNRASENKYKLIDASGTVLFERTGMSNTTQYKDTFDLAPGCYSIILEDTDHDGIAFWASAQFEGESSGQFRLRKVGGSYIEFFPGDFGHYHRYNFSVGFTLGTEEAELTHEVAVFPNPTSGECTIEVSGFVNGKADLAIYDLTGRLVHSEAMLATSNFAESQVDMSAFPSGRYIVKIVTNEQVYTSALVKQ
jgi:hypothetical protein